MNLQHHQLILISAASAAAISSRLPIIGKFFRSANTLIHESGHAFMSLLTSGNVVSIDLNSDTSGAAVTQSRFWLCRVLIALAGYVFSSSTAFLLFYLISQSKYEWVIYVFSAFALINLLFWVRNAYGIIWLLLFASMLGVIFYYKNPDLMAVTAVFFSAVVLFESVWSAAVVCWISMHEPQNAGDASNLKTFTFIPAPLWGLFFLAQAIYFAYQSLLLFV